MPESNPIERIDDLSRNISDRVALLPLADQELVGPERELALGLRRCSLQVDSGEHLDESPVEEDPRRERGGVPRPDRAASARAALDQPEQHVRQHRLTEGQTMKDDEEASNADE